MTSELGNMINELSRCSLEFRLKINMSKTKLMTNGPKHRLEVDGAEIAYDQEYIYLGQLVSFQAIQEKEFMIIGHVYTIVTWSLDWKRDLVFTESQTMSWQEFPLPVRVVLIFCSLRNENVNKENIFTVNYRVISNRRRSWKPEERCARKSSILLADRF
ncbi:hypothetical protein HW555_011240 [Spodoptera exigua]|uniref:Uncharacterized protein n=1 Tax=Spodoptera exigua TaxID=7107 RepID=A0A835L059_SPOEX|nr:hypothetical protein HW555_011240 [Spodoptera exigua]